MKVLNQQRAGDLFVVFVERLITNSDLVDCLSDADDFIPRVLERHAENTARPVASLLVNLGVEPRILQQSVGTLSGPHKYFHHGYAARCQL